LSFRVQNLDGTRKSTTEEKIAEQMGYKSTVKGHGSDRLWEWRQGFWWGDMCKMRWTRRVSRMY